VNERNGLRFCSRCGRSSPSSEAERVCPACGLGLLLWSAGQSPPAAGAAFAVVGRDLRVRAVSEAGEEVFGPEPEAVGGELRPTVRGVELEHAVRRAALRPTEDHLPVEAGALRVRVTTCGPPRAALVEVVRD